MVGKDGSPDPGGDFWTLCISSVSMAAVRGGSSAEKTDADVNKEFMEAQKAGRVGLINYISFIFITMVCHNRH